MQYPSFPYHYRDRRYPQRQEVLLVLSFPLPCVIANFAKYFYYLHLQILGMLFPSYPRSSLDALHSFVRSSQAISAAMSIAHDEMINIRRLDWELLKGHNDIYFAQCDDWVSQQLKAAILGVFGGDDAHIFQV